MQIVALGWLVFQITGSAFWVGVVAAAGGEVVLTSEAGKKWKLKKGDAFIIPAGFKGTWETVRKVRKHYVILLPKQ